MDLPPQPPPDVPAPPPGPEAMRSRRMMKIILLLGGISAVFMLFHLLRPRIFICRSNPELTESLSNGRQIGLNLFAFEEEYGRFPDVSTLPVVQANTGTTLALGNSSSNELFRQLLATVGKSERIFWAKTPHTRKRPNDVLGTDALVPGECAFAYIAGLSSADDPKTPIVMTPMIRGTLKFDPKPLDGRAVVLFLDSSVHALTINNRGDVILDGMNLFDPRQPFWRGKAPDIKYPE